MTYKAYIVANEQQEREVLEKFEEEGLVWISGREATEWIPSQTSLGISQFPYALVDVGYVAWRSIGQLKNYEIGYDGRKESKMSEKYVVSQEFMDALERWKDTLDSNDYVSIRKLNALPVKINNWRWCHDNKEKNNRLIAIIRWVNGEDVFEVEKPKKWIVRSKETDSEGSHLYVNLSKAIAIPDITTYFGLESATRFDTKEEAESWANSHQEVIEAEE